MSFAYHYDLHDASNPEALNTVKGVLSIEGEELLFEYKLYDMKSNVISTLNKYSLNVDYLKKVMFRKNWFGSQLLIESSQLIFLDPLPGSSQGKITLKIKREDRTMAQNFSAKLNIALSERRSSDK
jgi:hypothetical protein